MGIEDVLLTNSPHLRQFFGLLGFLFSNAYLAYQFFKPDQSSLKHLHFKMTLAEQMVHFKDTAHNQSLCSCLSSPQSDAATADQADGLEMVHNMHKVVKLPYQKPCYYCRHGYTDSEKIKTTFECSFCKVPLHKPSFVHRRKDGTSKVLHCWNLHLVHGKPDKRRVMNK